MNDPFNWFVRKHSFRKKTSNWVCEWVIESFIKKCWFIQEQNTTTASSYFCWQCKNKVTINTVWNVSYTKLTSCSLNCYIKTISHNHSACLFILTVQWLLASNVWESSSTNKRVLWQPLFFPYLFKCFSVELLYKSDTYKIYLMGIFCPLYHHTINSIKYLP